MLTLYLVVLLVAIPLFNTHISPYNLINITFGALFLATVLTAHNIIEIKSLLIISHLEVNSLVLYIECFIYIVSAACIKLFDKYYSHDISLILLFSIIGTTLIINATNILLLYLGIELQSFGLYIIAGFIKISTSEALMYFLLGALASSILLLGISIVYSYTGTVSYEELNILISLPSEDEMSILLGIGLVVVGLLFKLSAAPFHLWAPPVYDATYTPSTTYLIVVPKLGYVIVLSILLNIIDLNSLVNVSAVLSLVIGAVIGITELRIKRILTYSAIVHVGFLLLAIQGDYVFYLVLYTLTNLAIFIIITEMKFTTLEEFKGLAKSHPILALTLSLLLLSAAGVPPAIGFFAKYSVLYTLIANDNYTLAILAVFASVVSAVYYLRTISIIYFSLSTRHILLGLSNSTSYQLACLTLFVVTFWLYPNLIINCTSLIAQSINI